MLLLILYLFICLGFLEDYYSQLITNFDVLNECK